MTKTTKTTNVKTATSKNGNGTAKTAVKNPLWSGPTNTIDGMKAYLAAHPADVKAVIAHLRKPEVTKANPAGFTNAEEKHAGVARRMAQLGYKVGNRKVMASSLLKADAAVRTFWLQ